MRNIIQGILPLYRIDDDGLWRPFYLMKLYQDLANQELKKTFQEILYESTKTAKRFDIEERCYVAAYELGFELLDLKALEFIKEEEKIGWGSLLGRLRRTISGVEKDHEYYLRHLNAALRSANYHKVHPDTIEFLEELRREVEEKHKGSNGMGSNWTSPD